VPKRDRHDRPERFIRLFHDMMHTVAWSRLTPNAKAVLLHIWQRHNGTNNGEISYSVREADDLGIGKSAAAFALRLLIDLGFLRVTEESAFNMKHHKARQWALTTEKLNGAAPTRDYARWQPSASISQTPSDEFVLRSARRTHGPNKRVCEATNAPANAQQSVQADRQTRKRPVCGPPRRTLLFYQVRTA